MSCKLAIVIPYYKIDFFEATLQSLSDQTDKRFKVYIGDDASPDNCNDLLHKYQHQLDFEYQRFEQNLGGKSLVKQWERCIGLMKDEEWIMLLGDDDCLDKNCVAAWYEQFPNFNGKTDVTRFSSIIIDENSKKITTIYTHPDWEAATDSYLKKYKGQSRSSLSEYVFTKAAYDAKGFRNYPLAWHSDDMAWIDFAGNRKIFTINECAVQVRMSAINISAKQDNNHLKNEARKVFFKDLVSEKLQLVDRNAKRELLAAYEKLLKIQRKLTISDWFSLIQIYAKNGEFSLFLVRRILLNTQKKYRGID